MRILLKPYASIVQHPEVIQFLPSGSIEQFVVPAGVTSILAKLWSGGGGTGSAQGGGHSAFVKGHIPVTPLETLTIYVGLKGQDRVGSWNAGGGGGASAIIRGQQVCLVAGAGAGGANSVGGNNHGAGFASPEALMSPNGKNGAIATPCLPYIRLGGWGFGVGGSAGHNCGHGLIAGGGGGAGYVGGNGGGGTGVGLGGFSYSDSSVLNPTVVSLVANAGSTDEHFNASYGGASEDGCIVFIYKKPIG